MAGDGFRPAILLASAMATTLKGPPAGRPRPGLRCVERIGNQSAVASRDNCRQTVFEVNYVNVWLDLRKPRVDSRITFSRVNGRFVGITHMQHETLKPSQARHEMASGLYGGLLNRESCSFSNDADMTIEVETNQFVNVLSEI